MTMISNTALKIAAGICGTIFVGYCIYFDRQRRSDPNFKKKLRERRQARRTARTVLKTRLPDLKDPEAVQRFFLQEVQLGEEMLTRGELDAGVEHLSNAVAVCGQPHQLLQVLQQTLPPNVFQLLLCQLPVAGKQMMSKAAETGSALLDDDVE